MRISQSQLAALIASVHQAGKAILAIREAGISRMTKGDGSPVTEADGAAEAILLQALQNLFPDIPVVAEEAAAAGQLPTALGAAFFLVDPLDGTKEFIRGGTDFTVNVGLVVQGVPVFGIVYTPVDGRLFVGEDEMGWQAKMDCCAPTAQILSRTPLRIRKADASRLVAVASRSHRDAETDAWLVQHGIAEVVSCGSSIKFCAVASGEADVYPRFGPTMEWDTAAAHAVLRAAGGEMTHIDGSPFVYGKREQDRPFLNPGFVAWGGYRGIGHATTAK